MLYALCIFCGAIFKVPIQILHFPHSSSTPPYQREIDAPLQGQVQGLHSLSLSYQSKQVEILKDDCGFLPLHLLHEDDPGGVEDARARVDLDRQWILLHVVLIGDKLCDADLEEWYEIVNW